MPLVKRSSGWFWGSKGPFDSKAKALAVARAAYASGYREKDKPEKNFPDDDFSGKGILEKRLG